MLRGLVAARVGTANGGALRAPLSTFDVNSLLTRHADGDATALPAALPRVGPLEAKWLARLFLRDLKIGAESWVNTDPRKLTLVKLVLNAYSDGLFDFYVHRGDMDVAVRAAQAARAARVRAGLPAVGAPRGVADPGAPHLDPSIAPGTYVAVANAAPITSLAELPKRLGPTSMVSIGQKYDGERLLLHLPLLRHRRLRPSERDCPQLSKIAKIISMNRVTHLRTSKRGPEADPRYTRGY